MNSLKKLCIMVLITQLLFRVIVCKKMNIDSKTISYLTTFGYLPEEDDETVSNFQTDKYLREALKNLQKFAHIPVTGEVDEATKELLQRKRCGLPDSLEPNSSILKRNKRFVLSTHKRDHTDLTFNLFSKKIRGVSVDEALKCFRKAFQIWEDNSALTFREVSSEDADIRINFATGSHDCSSSFDGGGGVLAHAFMPPLHGAHFDEDENWNTNMDGNSKGVSLLWVALHEFGHSLGLKHSEDEKALMFPFYQEIGGDFSLPKDDQLAIQKLYGPKKQKVSRPSTPSIPPSQPWNSDKRPYYPGISNAPQRPFQSDDRPSYPDRGHVNQPSRPSDRPSYADGSYVNQPSRPSDRPSYPDRGHVNQPSRPSDRPSYADGRYVNQPSRPSDRPSYPDRGHVNQPSRPSDRPSYADGRYVNQPSRPSDRPSYPDHGHVNQPGRPSDRPNYFNPSQPSYPSRPTEDPRRKYQAGQSNDVPKMPSFYPTDPNRSQTQFPRYSTMGARTTTYSNSIPSNDESSLNACETQFDAATVFRREFYLFKNQFCWRYGTNGLISGFPTQTINMFFNLPKNLTKVDAVYERPDSQIAFFIGRYYYVFDGLEAIGNYPKTLADLGLPQSLERIDAAFKWGRNNRIYIFAGDLFWRFNDNLEYVDFGYPKKINSLWNGIENDIDAAFQWKDGKVYFLKGKGFWSINNNESRVHKIRRTPLKNFIPGCTASASDDLADENLNDIPRLAHEMRMGSSVSDRLSISRTLIFVCGLITFLLLQI